MKIGVFDSGIGGKSIANRIEADFPYAEVIYVDDRAHVPYGSRGQHEVFNLTDAAIQPLLAEKCDVIVLACNTATAAAIELLRAKYPATPFIGLEPMVKPASELTKSGVIAICATPSTLASDRYIKLKHTYASSIRVIEPDCSNWAYAIEHNQINRDEIAAVATEINQSGADVVVLACTHYHWIKDEIIDLVEDGIRVIDPSDAISRRVKQVLSL